MCSFWLLVSLSFNYFVLVFLYIATLLISSSGDVELNPGPSMNPNSVNSSFDSYATLTNSGLSIMNVNIQSLKLKLLKLMVSKQFGLTYMFVSENYLLVGFTVLLTQTTHTG